MAENSGIAWTHHTVNPWWGCEKVSPACAHCYAETQDHRFVKKDGGVAHWGANAPRRLRVGQAMKEAFLYERRAAKEGRRFRVFCASMADFFEDRRDLDRPRMEFLDVIRRTPHLDWLILTKRPDQVLELLCIAEELAQDSPGDLASWISGWLNGLAPANVALGTTVESQEWAARRIGALLQVPARTHFVSVEPMLGPVNLTHLDVDSCSPWCQIDALSGRHTDMGRPCPDSPRLDWVIVGGESSHHARSMDLSWALALLESCKAAGVAPFMKQLSEADFPGTFDEFESFPTALQVRRFPAAFDYL